MQRDALLFLTKKGRGRRDNTAFLWLREAEKLKWVQRESRRTRERETKEEDKKLNSPRKKTTSNRVVCLFISFIPSHRVIIYCAEFYSGGESLCKDVNVLDLKYG